MVPRPHQKSKEQPPKQQTSYSLSPTLSLIYFIYLCVLWLVYLCTLALHKNNMPSEQAIQFACDADSRNNVLDTTLGHGILHTSIGELDYNDMMEQEQEEEEYE